LRRNLLSGDSEVTLVFATFIVDNDHHLARPYGRNRILNACECAWTGMVFSNNLKSLFHKQCLRRG
jgi:hypothetical protein